MSETAIITIQ